MSEKIAQKNLFFVIGAPGSGKTTNANLIAQKHQTIAHYSAGEMLRAEVAKGTELGERIDNIISKGEIVPIELINNTIATTIEEESATTIIVDGFPRSIEQMEAFDTLLKNSTTIALRAVIEVYVSEQVAKERIVGRTKESTEVRNDDNEEVFNNRMKLYIKPLESIQHFYQKQNLHHVISGEQSIEKVVVQMEKFILDTL
jgi:adenylate kinase